MFYPAGVHFLPYVTHHACTHSSVPVILMVFFPFLLLLIDVAFFLLVFSFRVSQKPHHTQSTSEFCIFWSRVGERSVVVPFLGWGALLGFGLVWFGFVGKSVI